MDFKYIGIKRTERCYPVEVLEMVVNPSLYNVKSQAYNRILQCTMKKF